MLFWFELDVTDRFCLSVNVVAFVYSAYQACDLAYHLVREKHFINHHLRPLFEFILDQASLFINLHPVSYVVQNHVAIHILVMK